MGGTFWVLPCAGGDGGGGAATAASMPLPPPLLAVPIIGTVFFSDSRAARGGCPALCTAETPWGRSASHRGEVLRTLGLPECTEVQSGLQKPPVLFCKSAPQLQ